MEDDISGLLAEVFVGFKRVKMKQVYGLAHLGRWKAELSGGL